MVGTLASTEDTRHGVMDSVKDKLEAIAIALDLDTMYLALLQDLFMNSSFL